MFKRKNKEVPSLGKDKVAGMIVNAGLLVQRKWAGLMQGVAARLRIRKRKWMVVMFMLFAGGYSLYLISFSMTGPHRQGLSITSIRSPKYVTHSGDAPLRRVGLIPVSEYEKILRFKAYMDSLVQSPSGKLVADSIKLARPGLLDSVLQIEAIYRLQTKLK